MRRQALVLAVVAFAGVAALVFTGIAINRMHSFSLGVVPSGPVAELRPGDELCQGPIDAVDDFARVTVVLGTFMQSGPALAVEVRDSTSRAVLTRGRLAGGYADNLEQEVRMGLVREGSQVTVCLTNTDVRRVAFYGGGDGAHVPSTATLDGRPTGADVAMRFLYGRPRSLLRQAPEMMQRATLFAPDWVGPWTLWLLFGLIAIGVPGLLTYAVGRAGEDALSEDEDAPSEDAPRD